MLMLSEKSCKSCVLGIKLSSEMISEYKRELSSDWSIQEVDGIQKLYRHWIFKNFKASKEFVDKISQLAEEEGHHPDITFSFSYADVIIYTHKAGGLAEEDFILAAKIDNLV